MIKSNLGEKEVNLSSQSQAIGHHCRHQGGNLRQIVIAHPWSRAERSEYIYAGLPDHVSSALLPHLDTVPTLLSREWCHLQWPGPFHIN